MTRDTGVDKLKKSQEVIIHLTFESINRGDSCIKTYCENNGVNNWLDFITFSSYRTAEASIFCPTEILYLVT